MLILAGTSDLIKLVTSGTADIDVHASYIDWDGSSVSVPGRKNTKITTATTTSVVLSPASSHQINVKTLVITNIHATTSNTVTVQQYDGTNAIQLQKVTLFAGETLIYNEEIGFRIFDASGQIKLSGNARPSTNEFRLTGVTATPVMTADSTALGTIYMTPWKGNQIAINDGANWLLVSTAEISLAVTGRTTDLPFDIFVYLSGATPTLEFLDWTSATARATALARQDGVWVKSGTITRRYLGTCRARNATTFHWVRAGVDLPAKFDLWNVDNRVQVNFSLIASTNTWNYTLATIRQAQASANYQVDIVAGLQEEMFNGTLMASSTNATTTVKRQVGIGYDSTTVFNGIFGADANAAAVAADCFATGQLAHLPAIGRHFYSWNEISDASGTTTWFGDNGALRNQSGMIGTWVC